MKILNFIWRNALWIIAGIIAIWLITPEFSEIRALLFLAAVEATAIGLSSLAVHAYTKLDFINGKSEIALSSIFVGVHICVGLTVLAVYIAQLTR